MHGRWNSRRAASGSARKDLGHRRLRAYRKPSEHSRRSHGFRGVLYDVSKNSCSVTPNRHHPWTGCSAVPILSPCMSRNGGDQKSDHEKELQHMKDGAYLISDRGTVVVIEDSSPLLKGKLAGAAIDVFPSEPKQRRKFFPSQAYRITSPRGRKHGRSTRGNRHQSPKFIGLHSTRSFLRSRGLPPVDVPERRPSCYGDERA